MRSGWLLPALLLATAEPAVAQTIVRLRVDNDAFLVAPVHDRDYTHGLELTVGRPRCAADRCDATSIGLAHALFTPDIDAPKPPPLDRPYAGFIGVRGAREHWSDAGAWRVDATLGVRGPAALGSTVQRLVHDVMGFQEPVGWENQLPTAPWVSASGVVAQWATFGAFHVGGWGGAEVGNMRLGTAVAARASVGPDGKWLKPLAANGFRYGVAVEAGVGWRPWDATLTGPGGIGQIPGQRRFQTWVGVDQTLRWGEWAMTWSMAWRSREFDGQPTGPTAGAIGLSYTPSLTGRSTQPNGPTSWPTPSSE